MSSRPRPPQYESRVFTEGQTTRQTQEVVDGRFATVFRVACGLLVLLSVGGYVLMSATFYVGNLIVAKIVAASGGPPNGGPPNFWITEHLAFSIWLFFLFCIAIIYLVVLIASLPRIPNWENHFRFRRVFRFSPFFVMLVLCTTNYVPTYLTQVFYTPRVFATYIACLLGCVYLGIFAIGAPTRLIRALKDGGMVYVLLSSSDDFNALLHSRPAARYTLTLVGALSVAITIYLTLVLIPNSFRCAPKDWWTVFWPT